MEKILDFFPLLVLVISDEFFGSFLQNPSFWPVSSKVTCKAQQILIVDLIVLCIGIQWNYKLNVIGTWW